VDESAFSDKDAAPKMATAAAPRQESISALPPESSLGALWDSFTSPYGKYRNEIAATYKKSLYTIPAMVTEVGNLVAQGIADPIIAGAAKAGVKLGVLDSIKDFFGTPAEYWSKKVQEADQQAQNAQVYSEPTGMAAQALGEGTTGLVNTAPAMAKGAAIATALPEGAGGLVAGMIINTALESVRQGQDPKEAVRQVVAQAAPLVAMGAFGKIAAPASKVGRAAESMTGFETGSLAGGMLENKQQTPQEALATLGQAIPFAGLAMREGRLEPPPPQEQGLEQKVVQATSPEAFAAAETPVQAENGPKAPEVANTAPEAVSPPTEAPTAPPAVSEAEQGIPVTHMSASPEAFSEFSLDKAGTGEGAKIDNPENVRLSRLGVNVIEKPSEPVVPGEPETDLGRNLYGPLVATEDGQVHQVDATLNLKPDEILQREEPLTPEQVKAAGGLVQEGATGQDLMDAVRRRVGGNVDAERRIYQKLGFKAMAQMAEENQGQTRKFVVFDPKDLNVEQHTFYDENGNVVKSEAAPEDNSAAIQEARKLPVRKVMGGIPWAVEDALDAYRKTGSRADAIHAYIEGYRASGRMYGGDRRAAEVVDSWIRKYESKLKEMPAQANKGEAGVIRPGEMLPVAAGRKALDIIMDKKLPVMSRMGDLADYAYRHAWAYIRAPQLVKAMIGRIAPTDRLKQLLPDFKEVADKDNILGLYDQRLAQAKEAAAKAAVAAQSGDKGAAQKFIKEAQDATKAAAAIKEAHPLKEYQEHVTRALADPEMALMFKNYKEKVQPEMDQLYQRTRGLDPNEELFHRGRNTGVHANLLTEESAQKWREWNGDSADTPMPDKTVNASQHMNPKVQRDRFARRAKGTGDYSSDLEAALSSAVAPRLNNATKIELYDAVVRNGAGYWADKPPDQMPEGDYKRFAVDMPNGTVRSLMVRSDVLPELKGVLNVDTRLPRSAALNALNSLQVSINPVDAIAHVANLTRRLLAAQGYGHSFTADLSRQASGPIGATLTTTAKFVSTLMKMKRGGQPVLEQLARMADTGTARPTSKPHGWGKLALGHYFIQTFDQAARVMMDDLFSELVRRGAAVDTPANRREFVNHLGVYNRRVAGNIERALKDTGVSPFITAARRMPANAIEQLLLDPGFKATNKAEALKYRAANAAGIISTLMLPAIINSYTVGNPLGRPGTPFGAIDLGGKKDEDGKFATLDPLQWMGFRRGMRATGINAIIEGQRAGLSGAQIAGHIGEDIGQQFGHALLGPAMSFFFQAFTGRKLDLRGERVTANLPEAQTLERVRSALEAQNPVLYAALKPVFRRIYAQLDHELPETGATKPGPATKAMTALMGKPGEYIGGILESPWKSVAQAGGLKSVREAATAAQTEANTLMQSRLSELMTPEQQAKRELRLRLERQIRDGDPAARDAMRTALQNKQLTIDEAYGVLKKAQTHPLATTVTSLGIPESFRVARLANPTELRAILPVIFGKLANTQDEAMLAKYAPQLKALFEKARKQGQVPPIEELKQAAEDQTTETGGAK
jgi:hypothetical protein